MEAVTLKLRPGDQQKLNKALQELAQRTDMNIPIVLKQAGHVGVSYCKITCPVVTGRLRGSIGNPTKEGVFKLDKNSITFGTAVEYAVKVELTSRKNRHYMLRGVEQAVPSIIKVLSGVIRG